MRSVGENVYECNMAFARASGCERGVRPYCRSMVVSIDTRPGNRRRNGDIVECQADGRGRQQTTFFEGLEEQTLGITRTAFREARRVRQDRRAASRACSVLASPILRAVDQRPAPQCA